MHKHDFKLMNNGVYGKTMEKVRTHGDFEIVNTPESFQNWQINRYSNTGIS